MNKLFFIFIFFILLGCNKPKTVLICGDHVCINKAEAEQYFEENLSLEEKVIDNKKSKEINLVEINLETNANGVKKISIFDKEKTREQIKVLSPAEKKKKKVELKKIKDRKNVISKKEIKLKKTKSKKIVKLKKKKTFTNSNEKSVDICAKLEKCSIKEISKYLVKQGKNRKFPDITNREN